MKLGSFFLEFVTKGADKVGAQLKGIDKDLQSTAASATAMKLAIIGAVIGIERLTGAASQRGMDLTKFNAVTGLSMKGLQEWQYIGQMYDVENEEIAQSFKNLQDMMYDVSMGKGMPEGIKMLGIDLSKITNAYELMDTLVSKSRQGNPTIMRNALKSFGLGENMFQMLRTMDKQKDKISKRNILDPSEIKTLTNINKQWKDVWVNVRVASEKLIALFGSDMVKKVQLTVDVLRDGVEQVIELTKRFEILKPIIISIGALLAVAFGPITTAAAAIAALMQALASIQTAKEKEAQGDRSSWITRINDAARGDFGALTRNYEKSLFDEEFGNIPGKTIAPKVAPTMTPAMQQIQQTISNQFNIDGAKSPKATSDEIIRSISKTYYQLPTLKGAR